MIVLDDKTESIIEQLDKMIRTVVAEREKHLVLGKPYLKLKIKELELIIEKQHVLLLAMKRKLL